MMMIPGLELSGRALAYHVGSQHQKGTRGGGGGVLPDMLNIHEEFSTLRARE